MADASTPTKRRLNIDSSFTPTSTKTQQTIDTTDQNRADGFSPGNMIVTRVPGLDSPEAFRARPGPCRSPTWSAASTRTSRWW